MLIKQTLYYITTGYIINLPDGQNKVKMMMFLSFT